MKTFIWILLVFISFTSMGQDFYTKYDSIIESQNKNNIEKLYKASERGNTYNFVWLSYVVDANNTMYKATKNVKYLNYNLNIVNKLLKSGQTDATNPDLKYSRRWIATIRKGASNDHMNQKEFLLFEGYLFRYLSEFAFLVKTNNIYTLQEQNEIIQFVSHNFLKVYRYSLDLYGDMSKLLQIRTHIGSHWAQMALFLNLLTTDKNEKALYQQVITLYNQGLRNNFKWHKNSNGKPYYTWNSTWDKPFTNMQKERKKQGKDTHTIQDVSHGNQVIEYIINSYELDYKEWGKNDLIYLKNTLTEKIWLTQTKFADNVDGTMSYITSVQGTGYKQSSGWMKLMLYDSTFTLYDRYKKYYNNNRNFVDKRFNNLQYYANFIYYKSYNELKVFEKYFVN